MEVLRDLSRQLADGLEAASEGDVAVVEVDLLVVLCPPMLDILDGIRGDHMGLEHLELPPGLVVAVVEVEEQHLHLGEVLPGDRHLVELLRLDTVEVIGDMSLLGSNEHCLGVR